MASGGFARISLLLAIAAALCFCLVECSSPWHHAGEQHQQLQTPWAGRHLASSIQHQQQPVTVAIVNDVTYHYEVGSHLFT